MNKAKHKPSSRVLVAVLILLAMLVTAGLVADRYIHMQHRKESLAELAGLGLNHEFGSGNQNSISFFSTGDLFPKARRDVVIQHLVTLSSKYNSGLRYAYTIKQFDLSNCSPDDQLIEELRESFPDAEIKLQ